MEEHFLVTGCAGFIGQHLVRKLLAEGIKVTGVDNFSTGHLENIADLDFPLVVGDLSNPIIAKQACYGITHILHQAAIPSVPRSVDNPISSLQSSVMATASLFHAAVEAGVNRIVQAASSSAYGNAEALKKDETLLPCPLSPYAAGKLAQEHLGTSFSNCFDIDIVSLRYFNVFGPRQDPNSEYSAVIPKFIVKMLKGEPPIIYGDGLQSRDFTYVDNVVQANLLAARSPRRFNGAVMNIACGTKITLLELVSRLNKILGTELVPIHENSRFGDIRNSLADLSKAQRLIGYEPQVSIDEGLQKTVEQWAK